MQQKVKILAPQHPFVIDAAEISGQQLVGWNLWALKLYLGLLRVQGMPSWAGLMLHVPLFFW
jgi:hypothetical protein